MHLHGLVEDEMGILVTEKISSEYFMILAACKYISYAAACHAFRGESLMFLRVGSPWFGAHLLSQKPGGHGNLAETQICRMQTGRRTYPVHHLEMPRVSVLYDVIVFPQQHGFLVGGRWLCINPRKVEMDIIHFSTEAQSYLVLMLTGIHKADEVPSQLKYIDRLRISLPRRHTWLASRWNFNRRMPDQSIIYCAQ